MNISIKPLYPLFALLLIATLPALAQQGRDTVRPATQPAVNKHRQMAEELGLSKKQAKELKEVNAEFAPKIKALRSDSTLERRQKRQQVMQLVQQREDKIKGILTPDQLTKYQQLQKEQMRNRRNGTGMDAEADNP